VAAQVLRPSPDVHGFGEAHRRGLHHPVAQVDHAEQRQREVVAVHHAHGQRERQRMEKAGGQDVAGGLPNQVLVGREVLYPGQHAADLVAPVRERGAGVRTKHPAPGRGGCRV
jgi:hypothetical protein